MGTVYYWRPIIRGVVGEPIHIGKSSAGWCFALRVYPEEGIRTLDDWMLRWRVCPGRIDDGDEWLYASEMISVIADRTRPQLHAGNFGVPAGRYSERGPNGLLRLRVDGRFCIGHGAGTWDYVVGEFS